MRQNARELAGRVGRVQRGGVRVSEIAALLLGISSALIAVSAAHEAARAQVPGMGRRVEFIGLRRWTPQMIADSLGVYAPGTPAAGSRGALLANLHFAAVAAILYPSVPGA